MAKEQKSRSTIENYSRDLNDFLSAFPDIPFSELIEADESRIADYVDWLWKREAKQRAGQQGDRSKITYVSGPNSRQRPFVGVSAPCVASTAGVSGSVTGETPSILFVKAFEVESGAWFLFPPRSPGFQTSGNGGLS